MKIAVIIPVHNRRSVTRNCLSQLREISPIKASLGVVVVDDGSTDETAQMIHEQYPDVTVLRGDGNLWWTGAVNVGVIYALEHAYDSVLILNDDLVLDRDFLTHLVNVAGKNKNALVSSATLKKSISGHDEILTAGFKRAGFFKDNYGLHAGERYDGDALEEVIACDFLTGASLLVPIDVFRKIGIFDADKFPHNFGDFEFTLRASLNGFRCLVATKSKVYTEFNPNYPEWYFFRSSRRDYLRNLFNSKKFYYGFDSIQKTSYMHRSIWLGTLLYFRRIMGLTKYTLIKLLLTKNSLRKYWLRRLEKSGASESLINKIRST